MPKTIFHRVDDQDYRCCVGMISLCKSTQEKLYRADISLFCQNTEDQKEILSTLLILEKLTDGLSDESKNAMNLLDWVMFRKALKKTIKSKDDVRLWLFAKVIINRDFSDLLKTYLISKDWLKQSTRIPSFSVDEFHQKFPGI